MKRRPKRRIEKHTPPSVAPANQEQMTSWLARCSAITIATIDHPVLDVMLVDEHKSVIGRPRMTFLADSRERSVNACRIWVVGEDRHGRPKP